MWQKFLDHSVFRPSLPTPVQFVRLCYTPACVRCTSYCVELIFQLAEEMTVSRAGVASSATAAAAAEHGLQRVSR